MEQYTELYCNETLKLFAQLDRTYDYSILTLKVCKQEFAGVGMFSMSEDEMKDYLEQLTSMYNELNGECTIKDNESQNYCCIIFEGRDLCISGLFSVYGYETLTFQAKADQTLLSPLISLLKNK